MVIFESENSLGMDQDEIIQELPERLKEKARLELNETDENKHEAIEQLRVSVLWELRVWGTISISEIQISKVQNPFFEMKLFIKTKFISIKNDFFSKKYYLNYYAGIFQFRNFPIRIKRFVEIMNSLKIMTENKFWKILISRTKFLLSKISFFTELTAFLSKNVPISKIDRFVSAILFEFRSFLAVFSEINLD